MVRPKCCRKINNLPCRRYFKPGGISSSEVEEVIITLDELEAIRHADYEEEYQEAGADKMGVSRTTFGRIIKSAHKKVADALLNGKALKIEGGEVELYKARECPKCGKKTAKNSQNNIKCEECLKTDNCFQNLKKQRKD